jgi:hypothetical protein
MHTKKSAMPTSWRSTAATISAILTLGTGLICALALLCVALLARYDWIAKIAGFSGLVIVAYVSAFALIVAIVSLLLSGYTRIGWHRRVAIGTASFAAIYVAFAYLRMVMLNSVPAIHDITTDVYNPPAFASIPLRADNLRGLDSLAEWRDLHQQYYADLKSLRVEHSAQHVLDVALAIVAEKQWTIASIDPEQGIIEATAMVSFVRYRDDIVIRVQRTSDLRGALVDMRSTSRDGISDFGVNAARVREFMRLLAERV